MQKVRLTFLRMTVICLSTKHPFAFLRFRRNEQLLGMTLPSNEFFRKYGINNEIRERYRDAFEEVLQNVDGLSDGRLLLKYL